MTKLQILEFINLGATIYWANERYIVAIDRRYPIGLAIRDIYSDYYSALQETELVDCFY